MSRTLAWLVVAACGVAGPPPAYLGFASAFDHDDPAASEARLRALSRDAEAAGDVAADAEILTQIARAVGLEKRFDDADRLLDRAVALAPTNARVAIRAAVERGRLRRLQGRGDDAARLFHDAVTRATTAREDMLLLDAIHMLALTEPFGVSRAWTERGLAIAARSTDPHAVHWIAILDNNLGVALYERGEYAPAEAAYRSALGAYQRDHADRDTLVNARFSLAQVWRKLGRLDEALALQTELHDEGADAATPRIDLELAECDAALGRSAEARRWVETALAREPCAFSPDELARLHTLHGDSNDPRDGDRNIGSGALR